MRPLKGSLHLYPTKASGGACRALCRLPVAPASPRVTLLCGPGVLSLSSWSWRPVPTPQGASYSHSAPLFSPPTVQRSSHSLQPLLACELSPFPYLESDSPSAPVRATSPLLGSLSCPLLSDLLLVLNTFHVAASVKVTIFNPTKT